MNPLVLVVDDEPDVEVLFRQQFRRDLRTDRFTMEFAQSAPMALQRIADAGDGQTEAPVPKKRSREMSAPSNRTAAAAASPVGTSAPWVMRCASTMRQKFETTSGLRKPPAVGITKVAPAPSPAKLVQKAPPR